MEPLKENSPTNPERVQELILAIKQEIIAWNIDRHLK